MPQVFDCKEPDCPEKVIYEHDPIPGSLGFLTDLGERETDEVYLTCKRDHTHCYTVRRERK